jgi:uncharacterized protein YecE (DUF72 family)
MKKLKDVRQGVGKLLHNAYGLEAKLGPVLFQLPPGWKVNAERLEAFLKLLPPGNRYTIEFRNETWYSEEVYRLLRQYNCAFCIYELDRHLSPLEVTADFVYIRLHGPGGKYQGDYSQQILQMWSERIHVWQQEGKDVYVYFDNDEKAYAAFNAQRLIELVDQ